MKFLWCWSARYLVDQAYDLVSFCATIPKAIRLDSSISFVSWYLIWLWPDLADFSTLVFGAWEICNCWLSAASWGTIALGLALSRLAFVDCTFKTAMPGSDERAMSFASILLPVPRLPARISIFCSVIVLRKPSIFTLAASNGTYSLQQCNIEEVKYVLVLIVYRHATSTRI